MTTPLTVCGLWFVDVGTFTLPLCDLRPLSTYDSLYTNRKYFYFIAAIKQLIDEKYICRAFFSSPYSARHTTQYLSSFLKERTNRGLMSLPVGIPVRIRAESGVPVKADARRSSAQRDFSNSTFGPDPNRNANRQ
jgi:hypothetical protein